MVLRFLVPALALILLECAPVLAHGADEARFASNIPGWVVLAAAAAALVFSFLLVNRFKPAARPASESSAAYRSRGVESIPILAWIFRSPAVRLSARLISVALFLLVLATGFFGHVHSKYNAAPELVWTLFWFGLSLFSFLIGNPWNAVNPWRAIFHWASKAAGRNLSLGLRYPAALGVWPALILYVSFIWFELGWFQSDEPRSLALLAVLYSGYLWIGMALFGTVWLDRADPFTRYFQVLGLFAPLGPGKRGGGIELRLYASALRGARMTASLEVAFVIAMMYSVTYDGFMATREWVGMTGVLMEQAMRIFPDVPVMEGVQLMTLLIGLLIFVAAFWVACAWMSALTDGKTASELARAFGFTLLPIAFGYFLAHFFMVIVPRFAELGPALSDPFGWSAPAHPPPAQPPLPKGPTFWTTGVVWVSMMILIVLGHVLSVITA
ncbi:MAG: hypothetical protein QF593_12070, partial [Nitrospinota bacterium]|nr:hypothetical protein [Nitrospinota bacterium]